LATNCKWCFDIGLATNCKWCFDIGLATNCKWCFDIGLATNCKWCLGSRLERWNVPVGEPVGNPFPPPRGNKNKAAFLALLFPLALLSLRSSRSAPNAPPITTKARCDTCLGSRLERWNIPVGAATAKFKAAFIWVVAKICWCFDAGLAANCSWCFAIALDKLQMVLRH